MPAKVANRIAPKNGVCSMLRSTSSCWLGDNPDSEVADFRRALGQLWCRGVGVEPSRLDRRAARHRVRLPTYPFERKRYWIEAAVAEGDVSLPRAEAADSSPRPVVAPVVEIRIETTSPEHPPGNAPHLDITMSQATPSATPVACAPAAPAAMVLTRSTSSCGATATAAPPNPTIQRAISSSGPMRT